MCDGAQTRETKPTTTNGDDARSHERDNHDIVGIFTPARWGSLDGDYAQLPWERHFSHHVESAGLRIPSRGHVGWHVQGEWQCVWEESIEDAAYALAREQAPIALTG